jgi:hypothetical protein
MKSAAVTAVLATQGIYLSVAQAQAAFAALGGSSSQNFAVNALTASADSVIHGVNIGTGGGGIASNTRVGLNALQNNTTGYNNTANGWGALFSNTTGAQNTSFGWNALYNVTTASSNTATGAYALSSNTTGYSNTANGVNALSSNTTGSYCAAIGVNALLHNTTGSGNTAISPQNSSGAYAPVFDPTTETNRICMGSTAVTNAYIQVAWTVVSDERDKAEFAPVPHGLDFVIKLQPIAYRYRIDRSTTECHGPVRYGFKAQDVLALEGASPVIVDAEDAEKLRLNDQSMIAVLVKAIQELKAEFDAYKATH